MKKQLNFHWVLFIALGIFGASCLEDECQETQTFQEFTPLYANPTEFRTDPQTLEAREMEEPGKIYFYQNIIMVNEKYEGIHLIDNSDPNNPNNFAFLEIKGNIDVSVKGDILYADSYVDLLTIDISDVQNPRLLCRDEDVFQSNGFQEGRGYLIDWIPEERTQIVDCNDPNFGRDFIDLGGPVLWNESSDVAAGAGGADNDASGQGGSFARFSIVGDYIYVIDQFSLTPFDLTNPGKPERKDQVEVAWNIETLFSYKEYMFIGSQTGVYIYDVSRPDAPQYVSEFTHATACDPVIVKDDVAYITLRDETWCQNFVNQLDVVDVSDIRNPELIQSYEMENPHGLSITNNALYICEGTSGVKVFDYADLNAISNNQLDHKDGFDAYDAISLNDNHLLIIGDDGLYQFDTSNPEDLQEMSFIAVSR